MPPSTWENCLRKLEQELEESDLNKWIRPLQAEQDAKGVRLYAPNQFVYERIEANYMATIRDLMANPASGSGCQVTLEIGSIRRADAGKERTAGSGGRSGGRSGGGAATAPQHISYLNSDYTFETFVVGKSNQLAKAAAQQVADNPGKGYNPLVIYGGVGLGKTHLMHAIGNHILAANPQARVLYLHSEKFVADMVSALQHNTIDKFKRAYRTLNALLIDDIQFFARKERSQEEFFHTFNALLEGQNQIVLTCDRYPKEITDVEERLKSRFGWGVTVSIEPPDTETRIAIVMSKCEYLGASIPYEVAQFVGERVRSNIRELEGAIRNVVLHANFTGQSITIPMVKEALRNLLALHDRCVSMEEIQKSVAQYYNIRVADLSARTRSRSIARPRQIAMSLAKELTNHSLPEIGDFFGKRDHSTVHHACRNVAKLREETPSIDEDYRNLARILGGEA